MLAGRTINWRDDKNAPKVAVVNREFARQVFGSITQAVGGYFKTNAGARIEVAGVVEDGKHKTLTEDPRPAYFQPILQSPSTAAWLVVRSNGDPQQLAASVHDTLRGLDPGLPLTIMTWQKELDSALFAARTATVSIRSSGRTRWDAGGYRYLRHGLLLSEQAAAGTRHSRRPGGPVAWKYYRRPWEKRSGYW